MSNANAVPAPPSTSEPLPAPQDVRRTALYFESRQQWLFAWLHRPEHAPASDHGVLICPPVGHEQVHCHRSLRHLADALAAAGFPVLRFDYHGTGDSGGSGEDSERVATWLANIRDACLWLTEQLGCRRLSLIGLRLGATLAAQVAAGGGVDGLLLWAPVVKGRSYVREMKALSLTASSRRNAKTEEGIEAAGFVLTEQTAQALSRLDLLQSRPLCRRALIITRDDLPTDTRLLEHFQAFGIGAEQTAQPGYADLMAEPHYNKVPGQAIACAVDWLRAATPAEDRSYEQVTTTHARRTATKVPELHSVGNTWLSEQPIRERVLHVSQQPNLFGIVSERAEPASEALPFIVLVNAGSCYRIGPNRLYVALARQLACRGFRCLRMDLCGLGDSVTADSARENDPYPATAFRDIELTLRYLRAQLGVERVVLLGLCSGAYAGFQAAAQLSNPMLVESVLINPLTFFWREGMSLEVSPADPFKSFRECLNSAWQPGKWLKLLAGRSRIGLAKRIKMAAELWKLRQASTPKNAVAWREGITNHYPSHPLEQDLPGDLERVVRAGRHLACFFARSDPGYGILRFYARRKLKELRRAGSMSVYFLEDADHTFSRRHPRRALEQAIAEHLGQRYLRSNLRALTPCGSP